VPLGFTRLALGPTFAPDADLEGLVGLIILVLQLVAAIAGLYFLYLVFQDSVKWFLAFFIGLPVAYYVLSGMVGDLLAIIIVLAPTLWYVKEHWDRVGRVWLTAAIASLLASVL
jgi:hypothetical protein